jgi:hypothetical protein
MKAQFELEWLGGPAGARLRRRRPFVDGLPWGSIDLSAFEPAALLEARKVWTNGTFTEYASAAAFASMATAFMECGAPIDLVAAAADFVVDEMNHTELAARMVMELGGAEPYVADLEMVSPVTTKGAPALLRAAELAIKISCVGEALSVPILTASMNGAGNELTRAVLARLLRDEGAHARIGHWFLDWAQGRLEADARARLATIALDAVAVYAPLWRATPCESCKPVPEFGGIPLDAYRATMKKAVRVRIARPLAKHGIALDADRLADMLA